MACIVGNAWRSPCKIGAQEAVCKRLFARGWAKAVRHRTRIRWFGCRNRHRQQLASAPIAHVRRSTSHFFSTTARSPMYAQRVRQAVKLFYWVCSSHDACVRPLHAPGAQGRSFSWRAHGGRYQIRRARNACRPALACLHPLGGLPAFALPGCMAASTAGHCSGLAHGNPWRMAPSHGTCMSRPMPPCAIPACRRDLSLINARCCDLLRPLRIVVARMLPARDISHARARAFAAARQCCPPPARHESR